MKDGIKCHLVVLTFAFTFFWLFSDSLFSEAGFFLGQHFLCLAQSPFWCSWLQYQAILHLQIILNIWTNFIRRSILKTYFTLRASKSGMLFTSKETACSILHGSTISFSSLTVAHSSSKFLELLLYLLSIIMISCVGYFEQYMY